MLSGIEWLDRFARGLRRLSGASSWTRASESVGEIWKTDDDWIHVHLGTREALEFLSQGGEVGEAVTCRWESGFTVLFRDDRPTASAVLEELAHVLQIHRGRWEGLDITEMQARREIEAQECLDENADRFEIPAEERRQTREQLGSWRSVLSEVR